MDHALKRFSMLVLAAVGVALPSAAAGQAQQIDASGKVYFAAPPNFSIGSWVKYRTTGKSLQGHETDYTVTMLIAGEELWWGEPCFWLETHIEGDGEKFVAASLVSFDAFKDSMATDNFQWFIRKYIERLVEGKPQYILYTRAPQDFKKHIAPIDPESQTSREILGPDTVTTPTGHYKAQKVLKRWSKGQLVQQGDSTVNYRRIENSTLYYSDDVPITRLAREDVENVQEGSTWLSGQTHRPPMRVLERALGAMTLVGVGKSGLEPLLVPPEFRKPWREQAPNPPPDRWRALPKPRLSKD